MISCRQARETILGTVRRQSSEADRLWLEVHLNDCPACRTEKAQWSLLERLREEPTPRLGTDARARVLRHLTNLPPAEPSPEPPRFRLGRFALATCLVLVSSLWVWRSTTTNPSPEVASTSIRAQAAGVLASAGAQINYQAGAAFDVQPAKRAIQLLAGEIDVEVTPGGPGRFRVITPRFTVEVLGTHFVVHMDGVRTLHGVVRVVDASGRELSMVQAGQSWKVAALARAQGYETGTPVPLASPTVPGEAQTARRQQKAESVAMRSPSRHARPTATEPSEAPSVDSLLAEARILLATGDTSLARERIATALQSPITARQRASAELLTANSLLAESRYQEAVVAFRRTANLYSNQPEGELAIFAMAQLLSEQGSKREAQAALRQYLERYPNGQFVDEVRRQLTVPLASDPVLAP
jgi:ferric-dicitrate binding protein FerR (iron transport regulator)